MKFSVGILAIAVSVLQPLVTATPAFSESHEIVARQCAGPSNSNVIVGGKCNGSFCIGDFTPSGCSGSTPLDDRNADACAGKAPGDLCIARFTGCCDNAVPDKL